MQTEENRLSVFADGKTTTPIPELASVARLVKGIRSGKHKPQTEALRALTDPDQARAYKATHFAAVTWSGTFSPDRKADSLQSHSRLICLDLDKLPPERLAELQEQIQGDEYTHVLFISPSGNGLKVVIKIDLTDPTQHRAFFDQLSDYFREVYGVEIDKACKDVNRLCFLPHDPEAYFNPKSEVMPLLEEHAHPLPPSQPAPGQADAPVAPPEVEPLDEATRRRINDAISRAHGSGVDLTARYEDWVEIGLAFASLGEAGRTYFHQVSSLHPRYNYQQADAKFTDLLRNRNGQVGIGSFFHIVRQALPEEDARPNPQPEGRKAPPERKNLLIDLIEREQQLREAASKPVVFSTPLVQREGVSIIGRHTVNVIQGAYGAHKSRLAELFASLLLAPISARQTGFLGFEAPALERYAVCYIDTERNLKEEMPAAVQNIKRKAGYTIEENPEHFRFTSIKAVNRAERFEAIEQYIQHVRQSTSLHLFVLLDVVTDCVSSFNKDDEAMKLFDFVGNLCDDHNATFLLVIHQNPGTEKARGHTGTEAANKASTLMQIGLEAGPNGQESGLIRVRFLKVRRGKKPAHLFLEYSEEAKGLILADGEAVAALVGQSKRMAEVEDVAEYLPTLLRAPMHKNEVVERLKKEFGAKDSTIRGRLRAIRENAPEMFDEDGRAVRLAEKQEGKSQFYFLAPIG